jgi:hypothetical protein
LYLYYYFLHSMFLILPYCFLKFDD